MAYEMDEMSSFGYWVRRRRKALDLTQAALAHEVGCATITIRKIEHDERRPSRTMAERLSESLQIPEVEREVFISCGLGEISVDALPIISELISPAHRDDSHELQLETEDGERDRFVGRERELVWLGQQLESAKRGEGRIAFIAGEAGRGKTALMAEFAFQAMTRHSDLLVSSGTCNAFAGTGDPYLPFREVIGLLAGELDSPWISATQSRENARRLRQAQLITLQVLLEYGPNLIDVFIPGKAFLAQAMSATSAKAAWITQLRAEVTRRRTAQSSLEQSALFGEYTNVLRQLAEHHPLLVILDDLHWADEASLGLLFHLGRRLPGSRILVLAAYRPEELAHGHNDKHVTLKDILGEFKRTYEEVWIDLVVTDQAEGRKFVDAILDSEPDRFEEPFRQTRGHPLFTVELLRDMQSRGDLVRDASGRWFEGKDLDWGTLPARVEAVVARRLDRLDEGLWNTAAVGQP